MLMELHHRIQDKMAVSGLMCCFVFFLMCMIRWPWRGEILGESPVLLLILTNL